MTDSGKSLFYFGIYGIVAGLSFIILPETVISLTRLPSLPLGWARVIGLLALVIGSYDILCGKGDIKLFIEASVYVRLGFMVAATFLVVFGQMTITLIGVGLVDALGALWTYMALKSEAA